MCFHLFLAANIPPPCSAVAMLCKLLLSYYCPRCRPPARTFGMRRPLLTERRRPQLCGLVDKLLARISTAEKDEYSLRQMLKSHVLPLTNIGLDKSGRKFVSGSYDRSAKIWDTATGETLHTLEGHKNVVCVALVSLHTMCTCAVLCRAVCLV
jgi:hypothetical protein